MNTDWIVYILQCADGTLYTGITNNLDRRLSLHANGRGAKYLRGRGPLTLVHTERHADKGAAMRREIEIKLLDRAAKLRLFQRDKPEK